MWRSDGGKEGSTPAWLSGTLTPTEKKCYEHDTEPVTPVQVSSAPRHSRSTQEAVEARQSRRAGVALSSQANRIVAGKESHQLLWASGMGWREGRAGPTTQLPLPSTMYRSQCKSFWHSCLGT